MSSLSPVGVCRRSLIRIGVSKTIASIENPKTNEELLCAECYDDIRQRLLRNHTWNFAKKRVRISAEPTAPLFQYDTAYNLPTGFIRLIQIGDSQADRKDIDFSLENGQLLVNNNTNEDAGILDIVYIYDEKDVNKWDTLFRELVRLQVAHTICYALTKKSTLVDRISEEIKDLTPKSKSADGQDTQIKRVETSRIIKSRFGGCGIPNNLNGHYMRC